MANDNRNQEQQKDPSTPNRKPDERSGQGKDGKAKDQVVREAPAAAHHGNVGRRPP